MHRSRAFREIFREQRRNIKSAKAVANVSQIVVAKCLMQEEARWLAVEVAEREDRGEDRGVS